MSFSFEELRAAMMIRHAYERTQVDPNTMTGLDVIDQQIAEWTMLHVIHQRVVDLENLPRFNVTIVNNTNIRDIDHRSGYGDDARVVDLNSIFSHLRRQDSDPVPALIPAPYIDESVQRHCHICGGEVFTFFHGRYWCESCAYNTETPEETISLFAHQGIRQPQYFKTFYGLDPMLMTVEDFYEQLWQFVNARYEKYQAMDKYEYGKTGFVKWTNPIKDNIEMTGYYRAIRNIHQGLRDGQFINELRNMEQVIITDILRSISSVATNECKCNEVDALLFHFCDLCAKAFMADNKVKFSVDADMRTQHDKVQAKHYERLQRTLAEFDDYDAKNMATGCNDHGDILYTGATAEWIATQLLGNCECCKEDYMMYECPNRHQFCFGCILDWERHSIGSCPCCRVQMIRLSLEAPIAAAEYNQFNGIWANQAPIHNGDFSAWDNIYDLDMEDPRAEDDEVANLTAQMMFNLELDLDIDLTPPESYHGDVPTVEEVLRDLEDQENE